MAKTPERLHRELAAAFRARGWIDDGTAILSMVEEAETGRLTASDVCGAVPNQSLLNIGVSREDLTLLLESVDLNVTPSPREGGRTIVVGDIVGGNKVTGSTVHGSVVAAQSINESFSKVEKAEVSAELGEQLRALHEVVRELCTILSDDAALEVSRDLDAFTEEVTAPKPRRARFGVTGHGLIEAATSAASLGLPVVKLVESIVKLVTQEGAGSI